MRRSIPLVVSLLLAGCVRPPAAPPPSAPAIERPVAAAPTSSDWQDWPPTPGTWRYRRTAAGSLADYGAPGAVPALTLRCDRTAGTVTIVRPVAATGAPVTVRTTGVTRVVPADAVLPARDPLLDAMAFSRGRFVVERAGAAALVLPAWAEVGRVIEDCRG